MRVTVITVSDRASKGIYEDLSGPEITRIIEEAYPDARVNRVIVSDTPKEILKQLQKEASQVDIILTTGGTGISPRDNTPEITAQFCEKEVPGIAETLRSESLKETPMAMLSRGYAGMHKGTLIINFPGSLKAVRLCTKVVLPILPHAKAMFLGEGH